MHYDPNGNLIRRRDANQNITHTEFDPLNRAVRMVTHDNKHTTHSYDVGEYGIGRLASVVTPDMSRSATYDARGRAVSQRIAIDDRFWDTTISFDNTDRVTTITYPDGEVVHTRYDDRGFIAQVSGYEEVWQSGERIDPSRRRHSVGLAQLRNDIP